MFTWLHWIILIPNASAVDWKVNLELVLNLLGFVWDIWGRSCCCAALWSSQCPAECVVVLQSLTAERKVCLQPHWCPPSGRRPSLVNTYATHRVRKWGQATGRVPARCLLAANLLYHRSPFCLTPPPPFSPPPCPPPPLPLKGTLLRWTVCVTRWAGHTQWDTQLSGCPCVYTCVSVFAVSTLGSLSSLHMKMYFKWCVLSPLSLHTHTQTWTQLSHLSDPPQRGAERGGGAAGWWICLFTYLSLTWSIDQRANSLPPWAHYISI